MPLQCTTHLGPESGVPRDRNNLDEVATSSLPARPSCFMNVQEMPRTRYELTRRLTQVAGSLNRKGHEAHAISVTDGEGGVESHSLSLSANPVV